MVVDVRPNRPPVNIFINAPLNSPVTISANANLCSDSSGSTAVTSCLGTAATTSPPAAATPPATVTTAPPYTWSRLRLFGKSSGASCGDQPIQLYTSPDNSTPPVNRLNLQNAFLWFPYGRLTYPAALTSLPAGLVGRVCELEPFVPAATTTVASLSPNQVFDGLASIFTGGANQPGAILFLYRGFGSQEQRL